MSSIFIYGPPGTGKTSLCATMTNLGYNVHFLDMDRKVLSMENLSSLIKSKKITAWQPDARLIEGDLKTRVLAGPKKPIIGQPQGYIQLVDRINELEKNPLPDAKNTVIVVDSMTRVIEHMRRLIAQMQQKSALEFQDWGFILSNLEEFFDCFYNIGSTIYRHAIVTAHDQSDKDESTGRISIKPLIDGQMKNKIGAYVEEMYYTEVTFDAQGKASYNVLTKPIGRISQARTSRPLDTRVKSDFAEIFKSAK